jgi:hypothetical protein
VVKEYWTTLAQNPRVDQQELKKIMELLRSSDLSIAQIAERMQRTRGTIAAINRKYRIRDYLGKRSTWKVSDPHKN